MSTASFTRQQQTSIERLYLLGYDSSEIVGALQYCHWDEVAALAPMTIEAEATDLITAVADRKVNLIGPLLRRLEGQGVLPVTLCIGALWHFRSLHGAVTQGSGGKFYGARAEAMQRQAGQWGAARLEDVLRLLIETDLTLRSTSRAPAMAVMERAFIRISMMKSQ
jgi:DNA polymerase-3 subunit delta